MKRTPLMIGLLAAAAFAVGCDKEETTTQQLDQVQVTTEEAAQDTKDYAYAQKTEFTQTMQGNLDEINKEMDQLAARIEKSGDAVKAEARPKLQALREKADQLGTQLAEVKDATEPAWEGVKAGTRKAYESLKEGFQQSRQWVSEKIAP